MSQVVTLAVIVVRSYCFSRVTHMRCGSIVVVVVVVAAAAAVVVVVIIVFVY